MHSSKNFSVCNAFARLLAFAWVLHFCKRKVVLLVKQNAPDWDRRWKNEIAFLPNRFSFPVDSEHADMPQFNVLMLIASVIIFFLRRGLFFFLSSSQSVQFFLNMEEQKIYSQYTVNATAWVVMWIVNEEDEYKTANERKKLCMKRI